MPRSDESPVKTAASISVIALLASMFVMAAGNGMLLTLLPVTVEASGGSSAFAASLSTAYFVGLVGGSLCSHALVGSVGPIRTFAGLASTLAVTALVFPLAASPPLWFALRALGGFCVAGLFVVVESWLNATATPGRRGTLTAVYMVVLYLALAGGQLLLLTYPEGSSELFSFAAILLAGALVPLALSPSREPVTGPPEVLGLRKLWDRAPLGLVGCFTAGLVVGPLLGLAPIWAMQPERSTVGVPWIMTAAIVGGLAIQLPVGWLSDRVDRRWILVAVLLLLALGSMALGLAGTLPPALLLAGSAGIGGLVFLVYPLGLALANDRLAPGQMVAAAGTLMLAYAVGAALSPMAIGLLMDHLGPWVLFPALGVIALLASAGAVVRLYLGDPAIDPAAFVPAGAAAAPSPLVAVALDGTVESSAGDGMDPAPSAADREAPGRLARGV